MSLPVKIILFVFVMFYLFAVSDSYYYIIPAAFILLVIEVIDIRIKLSELLSKIDKPEEKNN
ncbi:MAG: hypothetical protein IJM15_02225 [Erysipelotrichaceae bacterium]|nr:hypothetical protein [Erysipelotrichaceae bacterium]